jgi:carbamoyl-phosphate synthase large subunit
VIVQFGGQTPLKLALPLRDAGVRILGTSPDSIDLAEDRRRFAALLDELGVRQPKAGTATSEEEAFAVARRLGYPVIVRPSYVLGGRAMAILYDDDALRHYMRQAVQASPEHPVLVDRFLEDAFELDVDAVADGERVVIAGIMQHIEEAGIHSGDSSCVLPPFKVSREDQDRIRGITKRVALRLGVRGLMNAQFAIKDGLIYVLEVNPRASRTVPFVSKATGVPWAKVAAKVAVGKSLAEQGITEEAPLRGHFVKTSVFPWSRFPGFDPLLGPEMKSTGEVMGVSPRSFGNAFAKAQMAAGVPLPLAGTVFVSVNDYDKDNVLPTVRGFVELGFRIVATRGTAAHLNAKGVPAAAVFKVNEGRPNVADRIVNGEIQLVVNTPLGRASFYDETAIRKTAILHGVPIITTLSGAWAAVEGIRALQGETLSVRNLQEIHAAPPDPASGEAP